MKKNLLLPFLLLQLGMIVEIGNAQYKQVIGNLKFSHKFHAEDVEAECVDCHTEIESSTSGLDDNLPNEETCTSCHDITPEECMTCHTDGQRENITLMGRIDTYQKIFSHKQHLEKDIECSVCHQGVEASDKVATTHLPKMDNCITCHEIEQTPEDCSSCHEPEFRLKPVNHIPEWISVHRHAAQTDAENCTTCHQEQQCQDCHFGDNVTKKTHPLNWQFSHSIAGKTRSVECQSCHEDVQYCVDCHQNNFVLPANHSTVSWANPRNGGRHGKIALMNMNYCIVCHGSGENDPSCLSCHQN